MKILIRGLISIALSVSVAAANEVEVVKAKLALDFDRSWTVSVTLLHDDMGWDHYADKWRLVDSNGTVLGERVLLHPHDNEQPFERSVSGIDIPEGASHLYVEAHDTVHGWSDQRLEIDLGELSEEGRLIVLP